MPFVTIRMDFTHLLKFGWENYLSNTMFNRRIPLLRKFSSGDYLLSHTIIYPLAIQVSLRVFACNFQEVILAACFMLSHAEKYLPEYKLVSLMTLQQDRWLAMIEVCMKPLGSLSNNRIPRSCLQVLWFSVCVEWGLKSSFLINALGDSEISNHHSPLYMGKIPFL